MRVSQFGRVAILCVLSCSLCLAAAAIRLPYRVLIVISDQWPDPDSYVLDRSEEFQVLAALLKTWGIPFDILRLDQQHIDRYHVLDRAGNPLYGAVLWDADPAHVGERDIGMLRELVEQRGVGLIALGDSVANREVGELAGLAYESGFISPDGLTFSAEHFVTRGLRGHESQFLDRSGYSRGTKVRVENATVLATRGKLPFVSIRQAGTGARVLWLGAERLRAQLQPQVVRDLLKRSIVWVEGYALYPEFERSAILFMDDWGTSDKTALSYWHYQTPTEERIRSSLLEPLRRHKAVMDLNVNTGYVDRKTQRILVPWDQRVVDSIDGTTIHDFASTKRGIDAGIADGIFNVQSHGWTHMLPDLDSPPGPWWSAPMDGVGSLDWYYEFGDEMRKHEIPAIIQRSHMRRSIEYIQHDFGVVPLVFRPGGIRFSHSLENNTFRIAAQMGFGVATVDWAYYLGTDGVISLETVSRKAGWDYQQHVNPAEIPWSVDAPYWIGFHDRDLALDQQSIERLLTELGPGVRYMSGSEYGGYLHAKVWSAIDGNDTLSFKVNYDEHYCHYFAGHRSNWTLHLSDEMRASLKQSVPEKQTIQIPEGVGEYTVEVGSFRRTVTR